MISIVSLLVALALVSLQTTSAYTHIDNAKIDMDNNLQPNSFSDIPSSRKRLLKNFVRITEPPPKTIRFVPGSTTVIECGATGLPAPMIEWLKNGLPISDFEEDTNEIVSTHPKSMGHLFRKLVVQQPESGDVYTCVAVGGMKKDVASTTVFVEDGEAADLMPLKPTKPIITTYYKQIIQNQRTSLTLPCSVYTTSPSEVFWLDRDDKLVFESQRMRILPSGALHINGLIWDDMGEYTCNVKNMYGKTSIKTFVYPAVP